MISKQYMKPEYIFDTKDWGSYASSDISVEAFANMELVHTNNAQIRFLGDNISPLQAISELSRSRPEIIERLFTLTRMTNIAIDELEGLHQKMFNSDMSISPHARQSNSFTRIKLKSWTVVLFLRTLLDVCIMLHSNDELDSIANIFSKTKDNDKKCKIDNINNRLNLSTGARHFLKVVIDSSNNIKHLKNDSAQYTSLSRDFYPNIILPLHAYDENFEPQKNEDGTIMIHLCEQSVGDLVHGTNFFILKILDTVLNT